MAVHAYFMAMFVAAAVGGAADVPARAEPDLLISVNRVLADVSELAVALVMEETPGVERLIDVPKLKAQIVPRLRDGGITPLERGTETTPRLVVHIEGVEVPDCNKYVFRIQTAMSRLVTPPGLANRWLQTEVWRVRPVMEVVARPEAGKAIEAAVLVQAEAFIGAYKAAQSVLGVMEDVGKDAPAADGQGQATPQNLQAAASHPFIASKSSDVFHRPDCRWAQNISGNNLVGYKTREEAVQSGKRPCKSCKP
jgi:hypothetical protein